MGQESNDLASPPRGDRTVSLILFSVSEHVSWQERCTAASDVDNFHEFAGNFSTPFCQNPVDANQSIQLLGNGREIGSRGMT
jgi:hypothetical protein